MHLKHNNRRTPYPSVISVELLGGMQMSTNDQPTCNQGRLNQWAHWARAQGPRIFFFFLRGPQLAVVKYFFKTDYLIVDATA